MVVDFSAHTRLARLALFSTELEALAADARALLHLQACCWHTQGGCPAGSRRRGPSSSTRCCQWYSAQRAA